jgi:hypothetical protein
VVVAALLLLTITGVAEENDDFLRNLTVVVSRVASEFPLNELLIGKLMGLLSELGLIGKLFVVVAVVVVVVDEGFCGVFVSLGGMFRLGLSKLIANRMD